MNNILYINATVRDNSRTDELAKCLLSKLDGNIKEIKLEDLDLKPLNKERLLDKENKIHNGNLSDDIFKYSHEFANADIIVISSPYWDYSIPALLKIYIENISVHGITFDYTEDGQPIGLCKAQKVYFITTAGSYYLPDYSYDYIKRLFSELYGIKDFELIYAEYLDFKGNNPQEIINKCKKEIIGE